MSFFSFGRSIKSLIYKSFRRLIFLSIISISFFKGVISIILSSFFIFLRYSYVLMFTGTPVRLNGDGFDDIADDLVVGKSVKWLQEHGNIANFKYYAPSMIDNSVLKKRGGEFTKDSVDQSMKSVIYLMFQRVISQDREWIKTLIISRDEFNKIRQKEPKSVDDNLKLLVNSFGNELSSYLYGADWSDTKYDLAVEIINKHDVFSGYKQNETYKKADKPYDEGELEKNKKLTQLEQLQQLSFQLLKSTVRK